VSDLSRDGSLPLDPGRPVFCRLRMLVKAAPA